MASYKSPFKSAETNDENGFDPSLSLSSFFSSNVSHFSPFLSSTILVRFLLSKKAKKKKGMSKIGCSSRHEVSLRSFSKHGGFRAGVVREREREREREKGSKEARACAQAYRRLKRGDASEREMGTVGRQGTSVRNENGSLHLLEEQRRPRLLHGIASIIPVGAYFFGL